MFHMGAKKIVYPSHQGPFHGKDGSDKNMLRLGQELHNFTHSPVDV